jgi:segregation and condensation protein B
VSEVIEKLKPIVEAILFASTEPVSLSNLLKLLDAEEEGIAKDDVKAALDVLTEDCAARGIELMALASGYQYRVRVDYSPWLAKIWQDRPPRYSRALLETLSLIIYRQPVTRAEIEEVRGVAVSSNIIRTLIEREWVKVVGYKDVPGKPAMFATTKQLLDYFNLKSLSDLPALPDLIDLENAGEQLEIALMQDNGITLEADLTEDESISLSDVDLTEDESVMEEDEQLPEAETSAQEILSQEKETLTEEV